VGPAIKLKNTNQQKKNKKKKKTELGGGGERWGGVTRSNEAQHKIRQKEKAGLGGSRVAFGKKKKQKKEKRGRPARYYPMYRVRGVLKKKKRGINKRDSGKQENGQRGSRV